MALGSVCFLSCSSHLCCPPQSVGRLGVGEFSLRVGSLSARLRSQRWRQLHRRRTGGEPQMKDQISDVGLTQMMQMMHERRLMMYFWIFKLKDYWWLSFFFLTQSTSAVKCFLGKLLDSGDFFYVFYVISSPTGFIPVPTSVRLLSSSSFIPCFFGLLKVWDRGVTSNHSWPYQVTSSLLSVCCLYKYPQMNNKLKWPDSALCLSQFSSVLPAVCCRQSL